MRRNRNALRQSPVCGDAPDHRRYQSIFSVVGNETTVLDSAAQLEIYDATRHALETAADPAAAVVLKIVKAADDGVDHLLHSCSGSRHDVLRQLVSWRHGYACTDEGHIDELRAELAAAESEIAQLRIENTTLTRRFADHIYADADQTVTIADVVDRYCYLVTISSGLDQNKPPRELTERDQRRINYDNDVRLLLTGIIDNLPLAEPDRARELQKLEDPAAAATVDVDFHGRSEESLYQWWDQTRHQLDHDIAAVAGVELLLQELRARDEKLAGLTADLCDVRTERDHLDQDNMVLADQLDHTREHYVAHAAEAPSDRPRPPQLSLIASKELFDAAGQ